MRIELFLQLGLQRGDRANPAEPRRSISPQSTQNKFWLRRLRSWLASLQWRVEMRALTMAPHCGQQRTGELERR